MHVQLPTLFCSSATVQQNAAHANKTHVSVSYTKNRMNVRPCLTPHMPIGGAGTAEGLSLGHDSACRWTATAAHVRGPHNNTTNRNQWIAVEHSTRNSSDAMLFELLPSSSC
jgi:hypothetical protein